MAAYSYSMAYYVYSDNPEIGILGSIKRSREMMYGHRWKLFVLNLTFIGWWILCILTCNIGQLWLIPYIQTSFAIFYHDIQKPLLATRMETAPQTENQPFGVVSGGQPAEESAPRDLSQPVNPQQ